MFGMGLMLGPLIVGSFFLNKILVLKMISFREVYCMSYKDSISHLWFVGAVWYYAASWLLLQ